MRSLVHPPFLLVLLVAAACEGASPATHASASPAAPPGEARLRPGFVVDSVLPVAEALRRFRADLGDAPSALRHAAPSRAALVRRFVDATARADTASLRDLAIDREEFAWLVYPESPYTRPPYAQAPGIVWMLLQQGNASGLRRLLRDRAEHGAWRALGHRCDAAPALEGANRLWRNCRVRIARAGGDTLSARLFGVIVERDGRFKFASYANDF